MSFYLEQLSFSIRSVCSSAVWILLVGSDSEINHTIFNRTSEYNEAIFQYFYCSLNIS